MAQNLIELIGEKIDIEDLLFALQTSEWEILNQDEKFYLTSKRVSNLTDYNEILSEGRSFLKILNGAAKVIDRDHKEVTTGSMITIEKNGNRSILVPLSGTIHIRSRIRGILSTSNKDSDKEKSTQIENWLKVADEFPTVRDALYFFNELSWWNLYKIYEIIDFDLGGKQRIINLFDKKKLKLFTQTCQSRKAIGDLARHATPKYLPPKEELSINDAHKIIAQLFANWVNEKG